MKTLNARQIAAIRIAKMSKNDDSKDFRFWLRLAHQVAFRTQCIIPK